MVMYSPEDLRPLIDKKKSGGKLEAKDIAMWVKGVVAGHYPDFQNTALLMSILLRGMNFSETVALTREMANHGSQLTRPKSIKRIGKHSTGGVGDKTTFILGPLLASYGLQVPFMSGRGLGHTGGTIDKLSDTAGVKTDMTPNRVEKLLDQQGFCIFAQNRYFAPADAKIYALRDASSTVDSVPLIVSSILSKKLQEGLHGLLLDVKFGSGAIMGSLDQAKKLGGLLLKVAGAFNLKTTVVYSMMEQPLGFAVGNNLEIQECLAVLNGEGPKDLIRLCVRLASEMLKLAGTTKSYPTLSEIKRQLTSGKVLPLFLAGMRSHGAQRHAFDKLKAAKKTLEISSRKSGWVRALDARKVGEASMLLGAGRKYLGGGIDPEVGVLLRVKQGDRVSKGQSWARLFFRSSKNLPQVLTLLRSAFEVVNNSQKSPPIIVGVRQNF